jgi:hypothetical protein
MNNAAAAAITPKRRRRRHFSIVFPNGPDCLIMDGRHGFPATVLGANSWTASPLATVALPLLQYEAIFASQTLERHSLGSSSTATIAWSRQHGISTNHHVASLDYVTHVNWQGSAQLK